MKGSQSVSQTPNMSYQVQGTIQVLLVEFFFYLIEYNLYELDLQKVHRHTYLLSFRGLSNRRMSAFRSCYSELAELRSLVPVNVPVVALTQPLQQNPLLMKYVLH